jgi:hypothetical protein
MDKVKKVDNNEAFYTKKVFFFHFLNQNFHLMIYFFHFKPPCPAQGRGTTMHENRLVGSTIFVLNNFESIEIRSK